MFQKIIISLTVIQTIAIGFLILEIREIRQKPANVITVPAPQVYPAQAAQPGNNIALIRSVIREELDAVLRNKPPTQSADETSPRYDLTEDSDQFQDVNNLLGNYLSLGTISSKEMTQLEGEIAKLNPVYQKEMLSRLSRAFNSGELSSRL